MRSDWSELDQAIWRMNRWAVLFALAMVAAVGAGMFGLVGDTGSFVLILLALGLLVPLSNAVGRKKELEGAANPALRRYTMRMFNAGGLYMAIVVIAGRQYDRIEPGSALMWLAALVPVVPALGMIWAMYRYLVEETDEYLRHRSVLAALLGLGVVLSLGTVWGFLETFGLTPHVWAWWVMPAWAIGVAIGQLWLWVRRI